MSNTAVPCTIPRTRSQMQYNPPRQHRSISLVPTEGLLGLSGTTICGFPGAVDQERLNDPKAGAWTGIKIHELRPCRRCQQW
jgi:hypothetical protein